MRGWRWLVGYQYDWQFVTRVVLKSVVLFVIVNFLFAISEPLPLIGRISIYNWLVPGRDRLPYGESSASYNLSLNNLDAMFSSHKLAQPKRSGEFRVIVVGDSSVWGVLLQNSDTLTGNLNKSNFSVGDKKLSAYNLGHPIMSATKDLMLIDYSLRYQPDLIVWMVTLESLPYPKQLDAPIVQHNAGFVRNLIENYDLTLDAQDPRFVELDLWGRTIIGQQRALADWWRLQLYGINWAATGIDQLYKDYEPRSNDFDTNTTWHGFREEAGIQQSNIAMDVLEAGQRLVGSVPLLVINEPIYVADGLNSDRHYNFWYPKWVYDRYRDFMMQTASRNHWNYVDLWDKVPPDQFTDSPVHLTPQGSKGLSIVIGNAITEFLNKHL